MEFTVIAASGIAEAAWMLAMMLMGGGMLIIGFISFLAALLGARKLAMTALVLIALFTLFFQP